MAEEPSSSSVGDGEAAPAQYRSKQRQRQLAHDAALDANEQVSFLDDAKSSPG